MAIKKIAICTGFDANETPIWQSQEIGVNASNVTLTSNILGLNNLQSFLSTFPTTAFSNEDYGNVLYLDSNGQIQVSNIPISWLEEKYQQEQF